MIARFFRSLLRDADEGTHPDIEIDRVTYAVGDIHGRADLLEKAISLIRDDAGSEIPRVVFMGDYIDRGEQSRQVLERLADLPEETGWEIHCLRGNHEVMLQDFLADPRTTCERWFRNGGLGTLLSYGVGGVVPKTTGAEAEETRDRLAEKIGPIADWLKTLKPICLFGNVAFTHAGMDPAVPIEAQSERTLYWGTPSFLEIPRDDGIWVVHGHYIVDEAHIADQRVAVDTGAYYSGRLTTARIATGSVTFLVT